MDGVSEPRDIVLLEDWEAGSVDRDDLLSRWHCLCVAMANVQGPRWMAELDAEEMDAMTALWRLKHRRALDVVFDAAARLEAEERGYLPALAHQLAVCPIDAGATACDQALAITAARRQLLAAMRAGDEAAIRRLTGTA